MGCGFHVYVLVVLVFPIANSIVLVVIVVFSCCCLLLLLLLLLAAGTFVTLSISGQRGPKTRIFGTWCLGFCLDV